MMANRRVVWPAEHSSRSYSAVSDRRTSKTLAIWSRVDLPLETVPQSVPVSVLISAKCWSEWQDLNLRSPRPERDASVERRMTASYGPGALAV
jgi:hypothetical protein